MDTTADISQPVKRKKDWWISAIPPLYLLALIVYIMIHARPGGKTALLIFYLGPFLITIAAIIYILVGIVLSFKRRPFFNRNRIIGFTALILVSLNGYLYSGKYPSSYDDRPSQVHFRLPLDTPVTVAWGGASVDQNYHAAYIDQCWAYDLLVMKNDRSFEGDSTKLESYYCYGMPVRAPASGKVAAVYDKDEDMKPGELGNIENPGGNHIVIEVAPKQYLFICHLKPKSIRVKDGDIITQGQIVAAVGNSGHTSEPHIHMHLQDSKELGFGEGIPLYFHDYWDGNKFVKRGIPTGGFNKDGKFAGRTVRTAGQQL